MAGPSSTTILMRRPCRHDPKRSRQLVRRPCAATHRAAQARSTHSELAHHLLLQLLQSHRVLILLLDQLQQHHMFRRHLVLLPRHAQPRRSCLHFPWTDLY